MHVAKYRGYEEVHILYSKNTWHRILNGSGRLQWSIHTGIKGTQINKLALSAHTGMQITTQGH